MQDYEYKYKYLFTVEPTRSLSDHFKAGAKWQKEQMMKQAVSTTVIQNDADDGDLAYIAIPKKQLYEGEKVKVIIIKEN